MVRGFGDEWTRFDQSTLSAEERDELFRSYFSKFPWDDLPPSPHGFDAGCGSGRWAQVVAPRVGRLICIDASTDALAVARSNLSHATNCAFLHASIGALPIPDGSCDFGYSLGVLHHLPDTVAGLRDCVAKLKAGAPFLMYLYYAFDNRPLWFKILWRTSEPIRRFVSRSPHPVRYVLSQVIAAAVYWPLARAARVLERLGMTVDAWPLSFYRGRSFYVMRTDALDRFGTRLEKRFTRAEIEQMMGEAGLTSIEFSDQPPYWCATGRKAAS